MAVVLIICTSVACAQKNFTYAPEKPKPGDVITFTYEPAGNIANTILPVEAVVYQSGIKGQKADDIILKKMANKFSGTITTDTAMNFMRNLFFLANFSVYRYYTIIQIVYSVNNDTKPVKPNPNLTLIIFVYGKKRIWLRLKTSI